MKDTFSFASQWDYGDEVFKDEKTGKLTRCCGDTLKPEDTAHLFYTARCYTNVQGGYSISYCYASREKEDLVLKLEDGLPAYGSQFFFYVRGDSFYFQPKIIYPLYNPAQKVSYQVTKQALTLNTSNATPGDIIMGYVDAEFVEKITVPGRTTKRNTYYLKGYIRTAFK